MTNIVKDLATLTTIPEKSLHKFFKKMNYCISQSVFENNLADGDSISELFIGIGTLFIKPVGEGKFKYHFEPSAGLVKALAQGASGPMSDLEHALSESLIRKFTEAYKDLCE